MVHGLRLWFRDFRAGMVFHVGDLYPLEYVDVWRGSGKHGTENPGRRGAAHEVGAGLGAMVPVGDFGLPCAGGCGGNRGAAVGSVIDQCARALDGLKWFGLLRIA